MRIRTIGCLLMTIGAAAGDNLPLPRPIEAGPVTLTPFGFIESIAGVRSQTTGDGVSTRFGSLPLRSTPHEKLFSLGHSRIAVRGAAGRWSAYYESDFLRRPPAEPYRIRQFFGTLRLGSWEFSAGREFSLLRGDRTGIASDRDLMNTRAVDPAYHVGVVGVRNQQARAVRRMGDWRVAVSFEDGKDGLVKVAHDSARLHWEAVALAGSRGHHGGGAAAEWRPLRHLRFLTQQFWARGGGRDALNTAPAGVPAFATLEGLEAPFGRWQIFSYAGLVYAARSPGNRTVRQATIGFERELLRDRAGTLVAAVQISHLDRAVWAGGAGRQTFLQIGVRQNFGLNR